MTTLSLCGSVTAPDGTVFTLQYRSHDDVEHYSASFELEDNEFIQRTPAYPTLAALLHALADAIDRNDFTFKHV